MNEQDYINESAKLIMNGKIDEALKLYREALGIYPENIDMIYGKAFILRKIEQYDLAIIALDEVLSINPEYIYALYDKALIYKLTNNLEKAINEFDKIKNHPVVNKFVFNQLGLISVDKKEIDTARIYFEKALQIDPTFDSAINNVLKYIVTDHT